MLRVVALVLVACEQAPPSTPEPTPAPIPAPVPPPIQRTVPLPDRDDVVMIRISPTELLIARSPRMPLTTATTDEDIKQTVEARLKASTYRAGLPVILEAEPSVIYGRIVAILDGTRRAGFGPLSFSVGP